MLEWGIKKNNKVQCQFIPLDAPRIVLLRDNVEPFICVFLRFSNLRCLARPGLCCIFLKQACKRFSLTLVGQKAWLNWTPKSSIPWCMRQPTLPSTALLRALKFRHYLVRTQNFRAKTFAPKAETFISTLWESAAKINSGSPILKPQHYRRNKNSTWRLKIWRFKRTHAFLKMRVC